jgi:hypothetical protein
MTPLEQAAHAEELAGGLVDVPAREAQGRPVCGWILREVAATADLI